MSSLNQWLESWCEWEVREPEATSILYRILTEAHVQQPPPSHRVLCMDAPGHIRVMRVLMRRLDQDLRTCLFLTFSYPMKPTGQLYTQDEIARFMGLSRRTLKRRISAGKQRIRAELRRIAA